MSELDEFAEALMGQLSVEIDEEKVIAELAAKIKEDRNFTVEFDGVESVSQGLFPELVQKVNEYMGLEVSGKLSIEYLKLDEFKRLKGKKVFTENGRIFVDKLFEAVAKNDLKKISELETKLDEQTKVTRETARIELKLEHRKKSRQQELEEYEKKYLNESATKVTWKAYDVKAKMNVEIQSPKAVKMKNGKWAVKGTSPITGIKVFRIVGNEKPAVSAEKTADSPKAKKEPTTSAEKPKGSQKTEPEVFSRYYRSPEAESPKVKKSKSKKSNPFCEECGAKIAAKDMFCINCEAKR